MVNLFAALLVALQLAGAQPPVTETTDVDENTTPAEASPLAPAKAAVPAEPEAPGRSLDDILANVRPVETPEEPKTTEEAPRAGLVLTTPANSVTAVAPTYIDNRDARPDGPPSDSDILYETRVLGAFRAAQGRQGPLDGRWLVARPGGEVLYSLQISDPGAGDERIEGAWRNMKAQGLGGTGFIETVNREDSDIVVRFQDTTTNRREEVRFRPNNDGGWVGDVMGAGRRMPVVLSRDASVELAAQGAPIYIPPPPPPAKPATTCKRVKSKGKWKTVCSKVKASKGKASKGKASKKKATASKSKKPAAKKPAAKKKK